MTVRCMRLGASPGIQCNVTSLASIRMIQFPRAHPIPTPRAARKNPAKVCHATGGVMLGDPLFGDSIACPGMAAGRGGGRTSQYQMAMPPTGDGTGRSCPRSGRANQCLARIPEGGIDDKGDDISALKSMRGYPRANLLCPWLAPETRNFTLGPPIRGTPTPNPSPPQVGPARLAHDDAKSGQARVSWGGEHTERVAALATRHRNALLCRPFCATVGPTLRDQSGSPES
jgi:hypothetical protein